MPVPPPAPGAGPDLATITAGEFARFRSLIRDQTGIHLSDCKGPLLVARLGPRLKNLGLGTFSDYYKFLAGDTSGDELQTLINRVTTHKTSFFRERHHFDFLRLRLIPQLREKGRRQLRIWSAGCSSGEEPYSIAMTVEQALGKLHGWDVCVLASDIDTETLDQARSGTYALESLDGVSPEQRRAYFLRGFGEFEGLAQVRPELRQMVHFRRINLNEPDWGVHERFDAIFCRNVIIYFDRTLQERIVERLVSHLHAGGCYFSGHSENLYSLRSLLVAVEHTIFRLNPGGNNQ